MPFAGDRAAALRAVDRLRSIAIQPGDELVIADNCGVLASTDLGPVRVVAARGERSPAHARNVGAAVATGEWILFLDADTIPPPTILDAYFREEIGDDVGALAGEIRPAAGAATLASRYGAARNFLGQQAHVAHSYRPRASSANLLVRRQALEAIGGFCEGIRTAEDTDFCWRLQEHGWRLELRSAAVVEHVYRETLHELRRQWRSYAAGRAWLSRRYRGFHPEPAFRRALRRVLARDRSSRGPRIEPPAASASFRSGFAGFVQRLQFLAVDVLLGFEELVGLRMANTASAGSNDHAPSWRRRRVRR